MLEGSEAPPYAQLVSDLGFSSPAEAANALTTAKRQFDRILREVIAEYAGEGAEIELELRELKHVLANGA